MDVGVEDQMDFYVKMDNLAGVVLGDLEMKFQEEDVNLLDNSVE